MIKQSTTIKQGQQRIYMVRTGIVLFVIAILFGLIGYVVYLKMLNNIYTNKPVITLPTPTYTSVESDNDNGTKTYTSNFMKISFEYPSSYSLSNDLTSVTLTNGKSTISFGRSGTQYSTVGKHTDSLINTFTQTKILEKTNNVTNSGVEYVRLTLENPQFGKNSVYFIVSNYAVFRFETNDPALFADLDTIAKSFRILSE